MTPPTNATAPPLTPADAASRLGDDERARLSNAMSRAVCACLDELLREGVQRTGHENRAATVKIAAPA